MGRSLQLQLDDLETRIQAVPALPEEPVKSPQEQLNELACDVAEMEAYYARLAGKDKLDAFDRMSFEHRRDSLLRAAQRLRQHMVAQTKDSSGHAA